MPSKSQKRRKSTKTKLFKGGTKKNRSLPKKNKFQELYTNYNPEQNVFSKIKHWNTNKSKDEIKNIIHDVLFIEPQIDKYNLSETLARIYINTDTKNDFLDEIQKLRPQVLRWIYRHHEDFYYLVYDVLFYTDGSRIFNNDNKRVSELFYIMKQKGLHLDPDTEIEYTDFLKSILEKERLQKREENKTLHRNAFGVDYDTDNEILIEDVINAEDNDNEW